MANEPVSQGKSPVDSLAESFGKINQVSADMITSVMKSSVDVFQSVNKISVDVATNAVNALNQALQGISSAIAPKK